MDRKTQRSQKVPESNTHTFRWVTITCNCTWIILHHSQMASQGHSSKFLQLTVLSWNLCQSQISHFYSLISRCCKWAVKNDMRGQTKPRLWGCIVKIGKFLPDTERRVCLVSFAYILSCFNVLSCGSSAPSLNNFTEYANVCMYTCVCAWVVYT